MFYNKLVDCQHFTTKNRGGGGGIVNSRVGGSNIDWAICHNQKLHLFTMEYICKLCKLCPTYSTTYLITTTDFFLAATKQLYKWYFPSVRLSVCLPVTPFWLCSHHCIIMKFSGVITNDQSKVHAKVKVRGQRSRSQRSQPNLTVYGL